VLLKRSTEKIKKQQPFTHIFKVKAPLLQEGEVVCLLGEGDAFGNWNPENAVMLAHDGEWWVQQVNLSDATFPVAYKYGVANYKKGAFVRFEDGANQPAANTRGKPVHRCA
jgi:4-alpha-glucanotransferase